MQRTAQAFIRENMNEWTCEIRGTALICCPEDKRCRRKCSTARACDACEAPVCQFCWGKLAVQKEMPAEALANDLLVLYPPPAIYTEEVTFMELLCASPCITTMICFSLEKRYLDKRMMDGQVWMPNVRVAARGNATTFPLPLEQLVQQLQDRRNEAAVPLPRLGKDLQGVVSVILKTSDADNNPEAMSSFVHQATVRRHIVVRLIRCAREAGHPARSWTWTR